MCSTKRIRYTSKTKIIETNNTIVRLKTVSGSSPSYGFNLHRNDDQPDITSGTRIAESDDKYTVLLCDDRWDQIRSKALNAVVETSWDDHYNMTRMKFTG